MVFVHGTPSWSFEFRELIRAFRSTHRCLAVDHLGFGLSDKPRHYDYSPRQHARHLEQWLLERNLKDITLVLHDFGGPIGFDFALRHPHRVSRLVMLNSWLWSMEEDPEFEAFARRLRSPLLPFMYRYLNFSARFLLPLSFGDRKLSRSAHRQYRRPFSRPGERSGPLALARALIQDQDWFAELWEKRHHWGVKPFYLIWGHKDPMLSEDFLDRFVLGFPSAQILRLETAGHFPHEEEPERVISALRQWMG